MPKRKAKEVVRLTEEENKDKEIRREEKKHEEEDTNLERRIDAIKAIRDIEIEQSLTAQRLLCSTFSEEQLETPVLDFFKENLPDVSIEVEDNGEIEFKWNHNTGDSSLGGYPLKWILYCSAFQTLVFYGKWRAKTSSFWDDSTKDSEATKTWRDDALCAWHSFGDHKV
ncbi:hypothetical protein HID58_000067 [Brassica napus]|uniref:Uncharacterized protein n=1 Tax=Brassica napus TaxID=3708 RepID=A0ABQ8EFM5_BRANA|nr:hypothetical protein HID58_000067 [Brassica napus]